MYAGGNVSDRRIRVVRWVFATLCFLVLTATGASAAPLGSYEPIKAREVITAAFPEADEVRQLEDNRAIKALYAGEELLGYTYQTLDFIQTPAYSGKPL